MLALSKRLSQSPILRRAILARSFSSIENQYLVVNAVGSDRPGIVSDITKRVVDAGGNVGESQAAKLGSHFGLMMLISVPKEKREKLEMDLEKMVDMTTTCFETGDPHAVEVTPRIGWSGNFTLSGADNPGIVHRVTAILAKHRLNIDKMITSEEEAPFGGTTLFQMKGVATTPAPLPSGFNERVIREELEQLGNQMNCDINIEDIYEEKDSASFYAG